ncbi:hypothetical protein PAUR_b1038 [Pseudoalteromonas aurantia 208]|uniref:Uncharacterized protein n=1 Tax=Pseudoalteromonas aurantia 208 TaxID=1314867 RepID=A0ABR9EIT6_9GAMM|nr:hypothetical protein [Pseudoalteromonas aurantia 208]
MNRQNNDLILRNKVAHFGGAESFHPCHLAKHQTLYLSWGLEILTRLDTCKN